MDRAGEPGEAARVGCAMDRHGDDATSGVDPDGFREALSHWASSVTLVAVRDGEHVHATTVTSFFPVSAEPPHVALSLGPGAQVLPWLDPGTRFAVSLLSADQGALATRYADSFPVGPSPFPSSGDPVVADAVAVLVCEVAALHEAGGGARLVVARVVSAPSGGAGNPLLRHHRRYGSVAPDA